MKKQQYKITYITEGNKYTLWATAGNLKSTIDDILDKKHTIVGIERI